nr:hypothetical protein [Pseudomonas fluorescens]
MTAIQICALIILIVLVGLTYWAGYRGGLIDGRLAGIDEGKDIQQSDNSEEIQNLKHSLSQAINHRRKLYFCYERALTASKLGEPARQTLLDIAEKLRIAAETFSAFRTGKKLERDTLALRDQALAMAALLDPATQLELSKESEYGDGSIHTSFEDAKKASLFFQQLHLKNQHQKMVGGEA